jgi:trimethylamine:corrinoid methyltransferase-like protein
VYGAPFVQDIERGRREATLEDFRSFVRGHRPTVAESLHHAQSQGIHAGRDCGCSVFAGIIVSVAWCGGVH